MASLLPPTPLPLALTGRPIDLFEYGNSFTARGYYTSGSPTQFSVNGLSVMLENMTKGQLRVRSSSVMSGTNGCTSTYLAANFGTLVLPSINKFDWLLMWGTAVNDFTNGISAATHLANLKSIQATLASYGKTLLLGTPYYARTGSYAPTTAQSLVMAQTNSVTAQWARSTNGVIYFDYWNDIVDSTQNATVAYSPMQDSDNLHPASLGVQTVAKRCIASIPGLGVPGQTNSQIDAYASTYIGGNLFPSLGTGAGSLRGTTGTVNTGCSGTLPTYWTGSRSSGSDTIVFAKVAAVAGYGSTGGDSFTVGVASAAASCGSNVNVYPSCPSTLIGQTVECLILMTMPSVITGISDVNLGIFPNYSNGSNYGLRADALSSGYWLSNQQYLIRTLPLVVPSGTTTFQIQITNQFLAGCNSAVTFSAPILRIAQ